MPCPCWLLARQVSRPRENAHFWSLCQLFVKNFQMTEMAIFSDRAVGPLVLQRRGCEKSQDINIEKLALEHSRTTASQALFTWVITKGVA